MKTIALFFLNRALSLFLGELWLFLKDAVATYERLDLHGQVDGLVGRHNP